MSILTRERCAYQFERYRSPPSERSAVGSAGGEPPLHEVHRRLPRRLHTGFTLR
ncbi:hypothetical protein RAJCM14343_4065 [Rhodococcus aetherivorans]|uniref:Uncharacterized protein n=1 Tax=Rhodococcus aetherivorans TaxID=191292 RepID=A0ABQ0YQC2_9NOCA|nr:hypothetical protein RAJCM14343_4065 [Rhodococcus aetherivorans]